MAEIKQSNFLKVLSGKTGLPVPVWMMRQAGRHLPEYLELRHRARGFMDFCYSPSLATEATLQPIARYDMDAAILFADILLVLDGLGLSVSFEKGVGPIVTGYTPDALFKPQGLERALQCVSPVFETVARVRKRLDDSKALIGFCGAPWTVALYAVEGRGGTDKSAIRQLAYQDPQRLQALIDDITELSAHYLMHQAHAGADALMLFESWAEGLPTDVFEQFVIQPNKVLIERLRALGVDLPVIAFPRGAGAVLGDFVKAVPAQAIGLDTAAVPNFIKTIVPDSMAVQGHLDPLLLITGGDALEHRVLHLLESYSERAHIFNLGHGVRPETPIAHVEKVVQLVRGYRG